MMFCRMSIARSVCSLQHVLICFVDTCTLLKLDERPQEDHQHDYNQTTDPSRLPDQRESRARYTSTNHAIHGKTTTEHTPMRKTKTIRHKDTAQNNQTPGQERKITSSTGEDRVALFPGQRARSQITYSYTFFIHFTSCGIDEMDKSPFVFSIPYLVCFLHLFYREKKKEFERDKNRTPVKISRSSLCLFLFSIAAWEVFCGLWDRSPRLYTRKKKEQVS